jgi:hypothetical protein
VRDGIDGEKLSDLRKASESGVDLLEQFETSRHFEKRVVSAQDWGGPREEVVGRQ